MGKVGDISAFLAPLFIDHTQLKSRSQGLRSFCASAENCAKTFPYAHFFANTLVGEFLFPFNRASV